MKTRLLRKLRQEAEKRIGVFKDRDEYLVIIDTTLSPNVYSWTGVEWESWKFEFLEEGIKTIEEAQALCKRHRRRFIVVEANELWTGKYRRKRKKSKYES